MWLTYTTDADADADDNDNGGDGDDNDDNDGNENICDGNSNHKVSSVWSIVHADISGLCALIISTAFPLRKRVPKQ